MREPGPGLHWLTLHFRDAALERRYRDAEDGKTLRYSRLASLAGMVLTVSVTLLLHLFVRRDWLGTDEALAGGAFVTVLFALGYFATFGGPLVRRPQVASAAQVVLFSVAMVSAFGKFPPEFLTHRAFLIILLEIFAVYGLLRLRFVPAAIACSSVVLLYAALMWARGFLDLLSLARHVFWLTMGNFWGMLVCYQLDLSGRREFAAKEALEHERARAEGLLLNILPAAIAQRLKTSQQRIAEHAEPVTVLFADIVGFTPLSARMQPGELVELLDRVFTEFDTLAAEHGLEKIKTIGDAYMAVAGLPRAQADHALRAARMALAMLQRVRLTAAETGQPLQLRVGLHTGPVVAGVIGRSKFSYDLWGDTVNTASRMESLGLAGAVHCTTVTADCLRGAFALQSRGHIAVKGKDTMETFLVGSSATDRRSASEV